MFDPLLQFLIPLFLTILIEGIFAYLLHIRRVEDQLCILFTNGITNPTLNFILMIILYFNQYYWFTSMVLLEIVVVIVEGYIFNKYLKQIKLNGYLLSLLLNTASLCIGSLLIGR